MPKIIRYKRSINSGDCIAEMAGMKHIYDTTGKKAVIMQRLNFRGDYYPGAIHPVKDENGVQVCMSRKQWDMLVPLLESQEYVDHCEIWEGQEFDVDMDRHLEGNPVNKPFGIIQRWQFYINPALSCDLSKSWISIPKTNLFSVKFDENGKYSELFAVKASDRIIVNRTHRYRNELITYFFLKKWEDKIVFSGTEEEHKLFCKENNLNVPYLVVYDFHDLSVCLNSCKFVLCNQSMIYNICEAAKIKRVLELCGMAPNCFPQGANGWDFFQQAALEYYVEKLMGETPKLEQP